MSSPENPAVNIVNRDALRRDRVALRQALTADRHAQFSAAIDASLTKFLTAHPPGTLAFCWPIRAEFDCRPLAQRLLAKGWRACIPTVVGANAAMVFRAWSPGAPMSQDHHGIPIPAQNTLLTPDVVLLPLVAFDAAGFRLGYGGGYFDRTLTALVPRPMAIGVGFELARVDSIRPEPHDIPLDVIVTEAGLGLFKQGHPK